MAGPKAFVGTDCELEQWELHNPDMVPQSELALDEALSGPDAG